MVKRCDDIIMSVNGSIVGHYTYRSGDDENRCDGAMNSDNRETVAVSIANESSVEWIRKSVVERRHLARGEKA
eukprot:gene11184-20128_t